jgi:hypothetical protein
VSALKGKTGRTGQYRGVLGGSSTNLHQPSTVFHQHLTYTVPQGDYTRHMTIFALLLSLVLLLSLTLSRGFVAREVRI